MKWYQVIQKYFGFFLASGMALGFFFPGFFIPVYNRVFLIIGTVITITFLTVDYKAAAVSLKKVHYIAAVLIISKFVLPFLLYTLFRPLGTEISIGVLLLCLTPFAAVAPTLTKVLEGDTEFILLLQIMMTLAVPLYMPFLILLFAGSEVDIDPVLMIKSLVFLIIIPFGVSLLIRRFLKRVIEKTKLYFSSVNILLIALLLTGLLASAAEPIKEVPVLALQMTGWTFVLGFILILTGWFCFFYLDRRKRVGLAVSNLYMNVGLTAVIAARFFGPEVAMFVLIYELPANLLPGIIGKIPYFKADRD